MTEVISVRFKKISKMQYYLPDDLEIKVGDLVIVETSRGIECGDVVKVKLSINEKTTEQPLKKIMRLVTDSDMEIIKNNEAKEKEAFTICTQKISRLKLDMKLVNTELTFDKNKLIFYFTSDGRVDFRELVKELAAIFRTRIELRQIGVRDEAKMINGIGMCGRGLCCATFLGDFQPVSIKMAKEQNLSLNPTKISGVCGRLMCCLKYEEDVYEELNKKLPNIGDTVKTPDGTGEVISAHVLLQQVKVISKSVDNEAPTVGFYNVDEITVLKTRRRKPENGEGKDYKDHKDKDYKNDNKKDYKKDNKKFENKKFDGKKNDSKKFDNNKNFDGKKNDSKKFENKKFDGKKNENKKFDNNRNDNKKVENKKFDGNKNEK